MDGFLFKWMHHLSHEKFILTFSLDFHHILLHLHYDLLPVVLHNLHVDPGNLLGDLQHVHGLLIVSHTPQCLGDDDDGLEVVLLQFDCLFTVLHRLLIFALSEPRLSSVGEEEIVLEKLILGSIESIVLTTHSGKPDFFFFCIPKM